MHATAQDNTIDIAVDQLLHERGASAEDFAAQSFKWACHNSQQETAYHWLRVFQRLGDKTHALRSPGQPSKTWRAEAPSPVS